MKCIRSQIMEVHALVIARECLPFHSHNIYWSKLRYKLTIRSIECMLLIYYALEI